MRTLLTILLAVICTVGFAQKKPKPSQALAALKKGDVAEAKSIIDAAVEYEKTKEDPKTWFYRGQIYATLDTLNGEPGAMEEALAAFDKALELDPNQKKVSSFTAAGIENIDTKRQGYYTYYYNKAVVSYELESFLDAANDFKNAYVINPTDTSAILNAAISAGIADDTELAKKYYNMSYDAGVRDKSLFLQLFNYAVSAENYEECLEVINKAREAYPNDADFAVKQNLVLVELGKTEEAMAGLEESARLDPTNPNIYFNLGTLKSQIGDEAGAMEAYNKALAIDPNHFNSLFNIGAIQLDQINAIVNQQSKSTYYPGKARYTAAEKKEYDELSAQIDGKFNQALPTFEKLYGINSSDEDVLTSLEYIYKKLKMNDKLAKVQAELKALTGN